VNAAIAPSTRGEAQKLAVEADVGKQADELGLLRGRSVSDR